MGIGIRMRRLWGLKVGVAVSLVLASLAAASSVERISVSPPALAPRSLQMATAVAHVLVDTPTSALVDTRQNTYGLEDLTNRAVLLGNIMGTAQLRASIAARAGVPAGVLQIETPLTPKQPRVPSEDGKQKAAGDILKSTDQYRLSVQANPRVPLLDVYAQTPTADSAAALADAAGAELQAYVMRLAVSEKTPRKDQIRIVQLGRAKGTVINKGVDVQVAIMAFLLTLGLSCGTVIFLARVRDGWRQEAAADRARRLRRPAPEPDQRLSELRP